jgi:hypothetical protein
MFSLAAPYQTAHGLDDDGLVLQSQTDIFMSQETPPKLRERRPRMTDFDIDE